MSNIQNFKKKIKNVDNLKKVILIAETQFNKKFNKIEIENLVNFINKINLESIYDKDLDVVNSSIVTIYKNNVSKPKNFDMQEYLKNQINDIPQNIANSKYESFKDKENFDGTNTNDSVLLQNLISMFPSLNTEDEKISFTKIMNRDSLLRDSNILLDSRYQNISNPDKTQMQFTIMNNSKLKVPGSGIITSLAPMRDILEIEIFPFSIPYSSNADNYYHKITLSILELASISIDSYEDCQFHFMFTATNNKNLIDLVPVNPIFRFYKPITNLNNLTLRFGTPLIPISFDNDRLYTTFIDYSTNPCMITFGQSHNLISGDLIYINDFTTLNASSDLNIINTFNDSNGHLCTRLSDTTLSINVDATQVLFPDPNLSINIYFGSKRILLPLKIRYLYGNLE
jgi:hypothetical protein